MIFFQKTCCLKKYLFNNCFPLACGREEIVPVNPDNTFVTLRCWRVKMQLVYRLNFIYVSWLWIGALKISVVYLKLSTVVAVSELRPHTHRKQIFQRPLWFLAEPQLWHISPTLFLDACLPPSSSVRESLKELVLQFGQIVGRGFCTPATNIISLLNDYHVTHTLCLLAGHVPASEM